MAVSYLKAGRAICARIIFALHTVVAVWRLYLEDPSWVYWTFAAIPLLLFVEGAVTITTRNGDEYKWFCPCVFIFLCGSVPPIWLLELDQSWKAINNRSLITGETIEEELEIAADIKMLLPGISRKRWMQMVEQSLLVLLVLGRWILPKGRITRNELSQLLLAYLAISSDIVELFNVFEEEDVRRSMKLSFMVLLVWSVSLIQFPLVMTTSRGRKARAVFSNETHRRSGGGSQLRPLLRAVKSHTPEPRIRAPSDDGVSQFREREKRPLAKRICQLNVWGIMSTVFFQDGPFFSLRCYLIFEYNIMSYTMMFFCFKNSLIILVQLYRLLVICCDESSFAPKDKARGSLDSNRNQLTNNSYDSDSDAQEMAEVDVSLTRVQSKSLVKVQSNKSLSFAVEKQLCSTNINDL